MKKQIAMKYENILNSNDGIGVYFWADYDNNRIKGTWYITNGCHRFYTVNELKKYMGGRL